MCLPGVQSLPCGQVEDMSKKRVLVTGAAGGIGGEFRKFARDRYEIVAFDRRPVRGAKGAVAGDLTDLATLCRAAKGCAAILHLAAIRDDADFMTRIMPNNILGTFNVFEAARRQGVRKVVFASSEQVNNGYQRGALVTADMPARPTNYYAVSKLFGEDLGRIYSTKFGIAVICLRIGWAAVPADREWVEEVETKGIPGGALSLRDMNEIISRSIDAEGVQFEILPAFSRNASETRDLLPLKRVLGYEPQDNLVEGSGPRSTTNVQRSTEERTA